MGALNKRWTNERLDGWLAKNKPGWKRIGKVVSRTVPVKLVCDKGHEIDVRIQHLQQGNGCKVCAAIRQRKNPDEVKAFFEERGYTIVGEYKGMNTKVEVICPNGSSWSVRPGNFYRGTRCPCNKCRTFKRRKRRTPEELIKCIQEKGYLVKSPIKDTKTRIVVECLDCGYERTVIVSSIIHGKSGCPRCSGTAKLTTAEYLSRLNKIAPGYKLAEGEEYKNGKTKLTHICDKGHNFSTTPEAILYQNSKCPVCAVERRSRENSHLWNPGLTDEERNSDRRLILGYKRWAREVKVRDNFTCQACGIRGVKLASHHIEAWNHARELRFDVNNGITLCEECHNDFHDTYGRGYNTREQFDEWLRERKERTRRRTQSSMLA